MDVQARTRLSFLPRTRQKVASRGEQSEINITVDDDCITTSRRILFCRA
jgi:hypothetical protein